MSTLLIHSCEGVVWSRRKAPNLYVVCQQEGEAVQRTVVIKRETKPKWDHICNLIPDSAITLRLWHDSLLRCRDVCLGTVRTELATLRDAANSEAEFIKLRLTGAGQQSNGNSAGTLLVRLVSSNEGATMVLEQARENIQQLTLGSSPSALLATARKGEHSQPMTQTLEAGLNILVTKLHLLVRIGTEVAKIHPYTNIAWTVLISVYQVVKKQQDTDEQLRQLVNTMVSVYSFVEETNSLVEKIKSLEDKVLAIVRQTVECVLFIREYMGNGFTTRAIRSLWDNTQETINDLSDSLMKLKGALETGLTVQGLSLALQKLDVLVQSDTLKTLDPMKMNATLRPTCLAGTCVQLLNEITEWLTEPGGVGSFFWLTGVAGCGKSTISTTIADTFRGLHRLGAFLFFDRNNPSESHPGRVIHTLAHSLALFNPHIGNAISAAIQQNLDIINAPLGTQFKILLLEPLLSAQQHIHGPILIVLDALDECGEPDTRKSLLSLIRTEFIKLPHVLRFLITSRREADLANAFSNHFVERSIAPSASAKDVHLFIRNELREIGKTGQLSLVAWPTPTQIQTLTELAGGLFIWAATAVKFINGYRPKDRMETVLSGNSKTLDDLYTTTLKHSASWDDPKFARDARAVMACIVFGQVPMTNTTIDALLGPDYESSEVLKCLGCVVHWRPGCVCRILHASFADYLTDNARSRGQPWAITPELGHYSLASGCLKILNSDLRFNICDLMDSHLLNVDVPDISNRVATNISPQLSYASCFWGVHLANSPFDHMMLKFIHSFFQLHFLFWLEVLSLLTKVPIASTALLIATNYVKDHNNDLEDLIIDITKFISAFSPVISQSAPHIYISAVSFVPNGSRTAKQITRWFPNTVHPDGPLSIEWPAIQKTYRGHTGWVWGVAVSPDGTRVASGSWDKTVQIWDIHTGQLICVALQHTDPVLCVNFSPDGTKIVSASRYTVYVWDTQTATLVTGPLTGHTDNVRSVHFSPDGRKIVSGSSDRTICVWDAQTGAMLGHPFTGHTGKVCAVNFSPDGTRIASGSEDGTVCVWDAVTSDLVAGPFTGHTGWVWSVHFSPNGRQIASGADDRTVCIWDALTGTLASGPFIGNTGSVWSVHFSPDGKQIASGSEDCTVRVWDAQTGALVAGPYIGHTSSIHCIAFSPDGRQIVSGSFDSTVNIWDAHGGTTIDATVPGYLVPYSCVRFSPDGTRIAACHNNAVYIWDSQNGDLVSGPFAPRASTIDFSPDGMRILSGSYSKMVHVWDAHTGTLVAGPFTHPDSIWCVQFSPDGHRFACGGSEKIIYIQDAESGDIAAGPFMGHTRGVVSVNFSSDGTKIASGSHDNTIHIRDAQTGTLLAGPFRGHTHPVVSVHFSPDSTRIASGSVDHTVCVWDAQSGALIAGPCTGHTSRVNSVCFSPDGRQIVSGSSDEMVLLWDAETGARIGSFTGHTAEINSVHFSPDGTQIVSGSTEIRVWKVGQMNPINPDAPMDVPSAEESFIFDFISGWIRSTTGALLLWVPPWLWKGLYLPHNTLLISSKSTTKVDYNCFVHGTEWVDCFDRKFTVDQS